MALLSRCALIAMVAGVSLAAAALPSEAGSGCVFARGGNAGTAALGDGPTSFLSRAPDGAALGLALGGLGAIAALWAGGVLLGRQPGSSTEVGLGNAIETETVLVAEPAEIETEVALALRR